jgi:hypothetical protein
MGRTRRLKACRQVQGGGVLRSNPRSEQRKPDKDSNQHHAGGSEAVASPEGYGRAPGGREIHQGILAANEQKFSRRKSFSPCIRLDLLQ